MKLDSEYTSIDVCPETGEQLMWSDLYETDGVCRHCGHSTENITHHDQVVGRWNRPSLYERFVQGKKAEFLRKDEEDKVWGTLKG